MSLISTIQPQKAKGSVLVVGAGIAGMQSSLDLANSGYYVYLLDKNISIGGVMAQLDKTFPTNDCSTCMISPKLIEVASNPNVQIISRAELMALDGVPGDFKAKVLKQARFIDEDVCSGCGECIKVCPVEVPADFNEGIDKRKAIYRHFPQAIPSAYAIDKGGISPCKNACPANVSAQGYVALIAQGKYAEALRLVRMENPLPAICGRVCTHPCELACARAQVDQPVAIRELKRFVADWEINQGEMDLPQIPEETRPEKVAIIGSGPAGLSAGYYLALKGYKPTIFESLPVAGGMMRVGIPAFRLPREVIDYEIDYIQNCGVEIHLETQVNPEELHQNGFDAVFSAVGAHKGYRLGVSGEGLPGVLSGVDFLREAALDLAQCPGKKVAVVGGGNVAIDAARTALRLGSEHVTILYRRSRDEMPAYEEEIHEALDEGIELKLLTQPVEILERNGRVSGVRCISMELSEPDQSGRKRPVPVEGSEFDIELDGVISAIGQSPDLDFLEPKTDLEIGRGQRLVADPVTLQTNLPWAFAGGDAHTGAASVIEAIQEGKEAAESIHRYLNGLDLFEGRKQPRTEAQPESTNVPKAPRVVAGEADPQTRRTTWDEVVQPLSEEQVKAEADRCLSCGICSECYQCLDVCQAGAIDHFMKPKELELDVGAVIMAPGFKTFDPNGRPEYGYGRFSNVVTSLEFERILSASGPYGGHLKRPGDGKEPKRVAWLQCVGSRDASIGKDYCSYVCCMYATKQAVIAQEHAPGLSASIYYMDIRAQGKGFDRYYERARDQAGVKYVRSMISRVLEDKQTGDLILQYLDEQDNPQEERFDMLVLSVGLVPNQDGVTTAGRIGMETDRFGFAQRMDLNPLLTSREGVYTCGAFQAPRDIPDTVMQASGAAAQVGELLAKARGSDIKEAEFPPERDISGEEIRIGVFVCHCGINIGGVVDVPAVVEYAKGLPGVAMADEFMFTCSTDSQEKMAQAIKDNRLNRVVVASCSPRTHESLFRDTLQKAGLNPYLFEMSNIRDQCSWVHQADHAAATNKSKDLVRMSVARAGMLAPLHQFPSAVTQTALIVGGGVAGMTAALSLAEQGFFTHLVEQSSELGGIARRLGSTLEGFEVQPYLNELIDQVQHNGNIRVHLNSTVLGSSGHVGAMTSRVKSGEIVREVEHGAMILATGAREYQPVEYSYGEDERVLTQLSLHEALHTDPDSLKDVKRVVMIQCVGSRNEEHSYCSRICCSQAVANALKLKELNPSRQVTVLYRDMRTFSLKELAYKEAREKGVLFVRYEPDEPPQVEIGQDGLNLKVFDAGFNSWLELPADRVVLSAAVRPQENAPKLASALKLPLDQDGFFMEAHLKLRPVDFVNQGVFMAGSAHGPKFIEEVISQAKAAASRAATVLSQESLQVGGEVAVVDAERCVACLTCVRTCPYGVPQVNEEGVVYIDPAACQGCGSCAAACPRKLIQVQHHTDAQILAKTAAL